jgi:hypothetical protein
MTCNRLIGGWAGDYMPDRQSQHNAVAFSREVGTGSLEETRQT